MITILNRPDVAIIVLTRNAGSQWVRWIAGIKRQTVQAGRYLVMDSFSSDDTAKLALEAGLEVYSLDPDHFNHGGTRQLAAELCHEAKYLVFLTQDAILDEPDSLESLLKHFADPQVGMAYGRHIPHLSASLLEKHARGYTYPEQSVTRTREDLQVLGFRAAFSSDVYAAYRTAALSSVGGFPEHIIVSEDSYVSARLLLAGWKTVYSAESHVKHSHHYSLLQTFRRYFDVGVFHASEAALLRGIGKPDKEAWVYVRSLIAYLSERRKSLLPLAAVQTFVKLLGFRLGKHYARLPVSVCQWISLQKAYWHPAQGVAEPWLGTLYLQAQNGGNLSIPVKLLQPATRQILAKAVSTAS